MTKRHKLLLSAASGGFLAALWLIWLHQRNKEPAAFQIIPRNQTIVKTQGARGSSAANESDAWAYMRAFHATNAVLRRISTNNAAFQEWGKAFMLKVCNDHLAKVPLLGLKSGRLRPEDVIVTTRLTLNGAEFELCTTDRKHSIYYERGILVKAVAHEAEMAGVFYDKSRYEHWTDKAGSWSNEEARKTAEAMLRAKGIDVTKLGGKRTPVVRPETFNIPSSDGSPKRVTVFYTVGWPDATLDHSNVLEVEFRHTGSGPWVPTVWFQVPMGSIDLESTNFTNLYQRFFTAPQAAHS